MRTLALFVLLLNTSVALAQQPIDVMQADLKELKRKVAQLESDAESAAAFRASQAAGMAELLSRQLAQVAPTKESAADWVANAAVARDELAQAVNEQSFLAHAPPDVRALAKNCVLAASSAQVSTTDNPAFALTNCTSAQQQELKKKLQNLENAAKETFDKCRRVVTNLAPEYQDLVPRNPHDVNPELLKHLAAYPDAAVRDCQGAIEEAYQGLSEIKDAKAIISNAMTLAANVCFASGGNPYVCGGMLALAILMEIFDGSGGGGNGDGPGEGPKEGGAGGGQTAPTISGGSARESDEAKAEREQQAQVAAKRGPASNLGIGQGVGNLGTANAKSNISCNGGAGRIRCSVIGIQESERFFYGHDVITQLASTPRAGAVTACLVEVAGKVEIAGIAIKDGAKHHVFAHNPTKGTQQVPGAYGSPEEACKRIQ